MKRLVFLHIPKTAGQTVHFELLRVFGSNNISPVRVHTQSPETSFPDADRYSVFSGHLDWDDIERVARPRVIFSVLREPAERIASFYFYLKHRGRQLDKSQLADPSNRGLALASELSADDYFCNPNLPEREFIDDHYDNFYTYYFASRRFRGRPKLAATPPPQVINKAIAHLRSLDLVCMTDRLDLVERLIQTEFGYKIQLLTRFANRGPLDLKQPRFAALIDEIQHKSSVERIRQFCHLDELLIKELGLISSSSRD